MKILILLMFLFIQELNLISSIDVKNVFKNLKTNLEGRITKKTKVQFVENEDSLEYPGNNLEIIKEIKEKWQEYYDCLINKKNTIEKPVMRLFLEGQYAE